MSNAVVQRFLIWCDTDIAPLFGSDRWIWHLIERVWQAPLAEGKPEDPRIRCDYYIIDSVNIMIVDTRRHVQVISGVKAWMKALFAPIHVFLFLVHVCNM